MKWEIPEFAKQEWKQRVEQIDSMSEEDVEKRAKSIMKQVDLDFSDLKDKNTLDIGSGPCMIEKATKKYIGNGHVVSLDDKGYALSQKEWLGGRVVGDAQKLPFASENFDLIISTGAAPPFFGTFGEEESARCLEEMKRVLRVNGQIRISPGAFGFIERFWNFPKNLKKSWGKLSEEEKQERNRFTKEHTKQSFQYLRDKGYDIELKKIDRGKFQNEYWLIKK